MKLPPNDKPLLPLRLCSLPLARLFDVLEGKHKLGRRSRTCVFAVRNPRESEIPAEIASRWKRVDPPEMLTQPKLSLLTFHFLYLKSQHFTPFVASNFTSLIYSQKKENDDNRLSTVRCWPQ